MVEAPSYLNPPGERVGFDDLAGAKARDLVRILRPGNVPYCQLLECRRIEDPNPAEVVVFEVDVQRGQYPVHNVRRRERIAAVFREDDATVPEALALRSDFPLVPHVNSLNTTLLKEFPRSLCLYDEPYHELKLTWTSVAFVERIREWLALTARGELHAEDQPLEPLLIGSPVTLVLPSDLFDEDEEAPELLIARVVQHEGNVRAIIAGYANGSSQEGLRYVAAGLVGEPQEHGVIQSTPATLRELRNSLKATGFDLFRELQARLHSWRGSEDLARLLVMELLLIVALPKTRSESGSVEASDVWAFVCKEGAGRLGERLGVWQAHGGHLGVLLGDDDVELQGEDITLLPLNVNYALSRQKAAELSGADRREDVRIAMVGAGALGSQVFMNLARSGYGEWTSIDRDGLLPHNLAKHGLTGRDLGRPKATAITEAANETIDGAPIARPIVADVLAPGEYEEAVEEALDSAEILLDASASVAVARHLARDIESIVRRVSLFFNPSGTAGVMLCEDAERRSPLDWLEMLYYRELINRPSLRHHLRRPPARVRYARSCRDLSSALPQDLVALHAAIGARALRDVLGAEGAHIAIWRTNEGNLGVEHVEIEPTEAIERDLGGWRVVTDRWLLDKVANERLGKLPNETGGVLVGVHDTQRQILYVVDALPSPPDSTEWPSLYIRGSQGLVRRIREIGQITDGQLVYVGEWHSHPRGCSPAASGDDRKVFSWLEEHLRLEGLPPAMLIVGEGESALHVGSIA